MTGAWAEACAPQRANEQRRSLTARQEESLTGTLRGEGMNTTATPGTLGAARPAVLSGSSRNPTPLVRTRQRDVLAARTESDVADLDRQRVEREAVLAVVHQQLGLVEAGLDRQCPQDGVVSPCAEAAAGHRPNDAPSRGTCLRLEPDFPTFSARDDDRRQGLGIEGQRRPAVHDGGTWEDREAALEEARSLVRSGQSALENETDHGGRRQAGDELDDHFPGIAA